MLNYSNLNDVEFEYLCQDIMQIKLDTELHRFARGKDGGIDLTDNVHSKNIVVQVKHYMNSSVAQLISNLKDEVDKVKKLSPNEYYICCSKELSATKVDEIYQMFSNFMESPSNIITLTEIDDFLSDSANVEILKKHYKLWIESSGILQDIGNTNIFIDCETLLAEIENESNLFVKTSAFDIALRCLEDNKTLFITGHPGVGKTMTSKMLVLNYAALGYRVRFSTSVTDLDNLKKSISRNPGVKEIILVDDCFGQAYFKMKESQSGELLSLINYVNACPNKRLILNSRITILQEAKERKPELIKCFEGKKCKVHVLDMAAISMIEKAKIFYNHISFNGMDKEYFAEIRKDRRYYNIIRHANYTPRIIEFICNPNRYKRISPDDYYDFAIKQLNNPKEIWKDEYERRLSKVDRLLLLTLYSLSDTTVSEELVKKCFERRIAFETDIDTTINQYEASLSRLLDGFVELVSDKGTKKLKMVNPSVNDYIDGRLQASPLEKQQLIDMSFSIQQKKRLLSRAEFYAFIQSALNTREIESYIFDNEKQKYAFISYYASKYKIFDVEYAEYIQSFLNSPQYLYVYLSEPVAPIVIFREILNPAVCKYYKVGDFLSSSCNIDWTLRSFDFNNLIEVICLIEEFYISNEREDFVESVADALDYALEDYCDDLDADEYSPDIELAIEMSSHFNGEYNEVDIDRATSYVRDSIISLVEDEIDSQLSLLPWDIEKHHNYTRGLKYSIYGAENLVKSYLDYDGYDYESYRESRGGHEDSGAEIDYIFNRD